VVGFLNSASAVGYASMAAAFKQGLNETGYVDGTNVAIEYRWADDQYDRLPALATDLVSRRVAVIFANSPSIAAAKAATSTIPIIMMSGDDPVRLGFATSFNEREIDHAFNSLAQPRADALLVGPGPFLDSRRDLLVALAAKMAIPAGYETRATAAAGGLISYGADVGDGYRRAGRYVGRILKGEKPAELPVDQATRFELVINLKTAKALGLTVPTIMQMTADEVIE